MAFVKTYKKYLKISALLWAVCLVVFVLVYMFVIGQQNRDKQRLERELAEQEQMYEYARKAAQPETQNGLLEQIEELQNRLNVFVADFEDAANLTFDISRIAGEKKVSSLNVKNREKRGTLVASDPNNIAETYIDVSFTAGFNQFASFLNALERHQPVLFVNGFTLIRSNQSESAYQVTMDIAALVKKQKETKTTAVASQQILSEEILEN